MSDAASQTSRAQITCCFMNSWRKVWVFTITSEDEWCWRAEHFVPRHSVVNHTGIIAHVRALHLCDVQTPRFLRDKASTILLDEMWVLVEDPGIRQLWVTKVKSSVTDTLLDESTPDWTKWKERQKPKLIISLASVISDFLRGTTVACE